MQLNSTLSPVRWENVEHLKDAIKLADPSYCGNKGWSETNTNFTCTVTFADIEQEA